MWTEKYRPESLDGIVGQSENIEQIKRLIDKDPSGVPHMLFHGPPGTGKTATAIAIAKELNADFIEKNASNYRGIDDIREDVIPAMRYSFRPNKIIFMDESDQLTNEAQSALRRPLEQFNKATVIFSGNNMGKLVMALQSRTTQFEFDKVDGDAIKQRLGYIAEREDRTLTGREIKAIVDQADGDMRQAINLLEQGKYKNGQNENGEVEDIWQK